MIFPGYSEERESEHVRPIRLFSRQRGGRRVQPAPAHHHQLQTLLCRTHDSGDYSIDNLY